MTSSKHCTIFDRSSQAVLAIKHTLGVLVFLCFARYACTALKLFWVIEQIFMNPQGSKEKILAVIAVKSK